MHTTSQLHVKEFLCNLSQQITTTFCISVNVNVTKVQIAVNLSWWNTRSITIYVKTLSTLCKCCKSEIVV